MSPARPRTTSPRPFAAVGAAWPIADVPPGPPADLPPDAAADAVVPAASRPTADGPHFHGLAPAQCEALLRRQRVGRLAYAHLGHVNIVPIHYVYADGWLYGRTGAGAKLLALRHHPWVAFEVDEVDDTFEWRSVVVRGALYLIARDGPAAERARWEHAAALLRAIVPEALTPADPTPERTTLFRIHVGEMTGRMARAR